jgi:thiol-disulfide isomerase/thioredoxin
MTRHFLLLLLATACALNSPAQSGRRISTPTHTPPIQPPLRSEPEPERRPVATRPAALLFLPESLRERQIKGLNNGNFRLADFHGKVIVINVWASWCGPCRREASEYEKVRKEYADRNVEFIGLTAEDPRVSSDNVNRFLRDVKFGFRLGWADREMARTLMNGRGAIPQTLVIDDDGRVVNRWEGYSPGHSGERLRDTIDHALLTSRGT